MRFHYSTVQTFNQCPYRYKLKYLDKISTIPDFEAQNALWLGTALHRGIEINADTAIREYLNRYPVVDDEHYNEAIKLEYWINELNKQLPPGIHELNFKNDFYEGTADLLVYIRGGQYDLYDFKYSNNIDQYANSPQLHIYKYYLEEIANMPIRNLYYVFVPKINLKQKAGESIELFRFRMLNELRQEVITKVETQYNPDLVKEFEETCLKIKDTSHFEKRITRLCDWCEFKNYCIKGETYMILPKCERRSISQPTKRKLWIYGSPFSGKTTFADQAPNPISLNTDGNIQFVTMPYVPIKNTLEGRQKIFAWQNFLAAIRELESSIENDFHTIIVDLLEDTYEACRLYMYGKLGITHESDDNFRAWDKVRTEFLSTIRHLTNLPYTNIILISHDDMSRDLTKRSGEKITSIRPNLPEKVAKKLSGMVDIVGRVVSDGEERKLEFKTTEVIFGGGRLNLDKNTSIPLSWDEFVKVFDHAAVQEG